MPEPWGATDSYGGIKRRQMAGEVCKKDKHDIIFPGRFDVIKSLFYTYLGNKFHGSLALNVD